MKMDKLVAAAHSRAWYILIRMEAVYFKVYKYKGSDTKDLYESIKRIPDSLQKKTVIDECSKYVNNGISIFESIVIENEVLLSPNLQSKNISSIKMLVSGFIINYINFFTENGQSFRKSIIFQHSRYIKSLENLRPGYIRKNITEEEMKRITFNDMKNSYMRDIIDRRSRMPDFLSF